jgi:hypothetical protein
VLKNKGKVYVEIPFIQPYHPDPDDYQRFTIKGIKYLMNNFKEIQSGVSVGPTSSLLQIIRDYTCFIFNIPIIRGMIFRVLTVLLFPFKYIDLLMYKNKNVYIMTSALYYYGEKSEDK